jgi:hypothetical protein
MPARDLLAAWIALVVFSIGTVLIASIGASWDRGALIAAGVLALAGLKARVILARYLGLSDSRFWTHTFDLVIGAFLALAFGLYVFGLGK